MENNTSRDFIQIRDQFSLMTLVERNRQNLHATKKVTHPGHCWLGSWFFQLVWDAISAFTKRLSKKMFGQPVNHEAESHNHHKCFYAFRLLQKYGRHLKLVAFDEAKSSFCGALLVNIRPTPLN